MATFASFGVHNWKVVALEMLKKLIKINLVAVLLSSLLAWRALAIEQSGMYVSADTIFLLWLNIHFGCIFASGVIGSGFTLIANESAPVQDKFIHPPAVGLVDDKALGAKGLDRKEWFSFFVNVTGFSLILMLGLGIVRVYIHAV